MDEITKRSDLKTLKSFNLVAYQSDDDIMKKDMIAIGRSPVVILEGPSQAEINKLDRADDGTMEKIKSAGIDCLYSPFYKDCVYMDSQTESVYCYLNIVSDSHARGIVYSDVTKGIGYAIPVLVDRACLDITLSDGLDLFNENIVDLETLTKSRGYVINLKRAYRKYCTGMFDMPEYALELIANIQKSIDAGTHTLSVKEINAAGITVNEYVLAEAFVTTTLVRTTLNLGYMHVNDYYPFEVETTRKKRKLSKTAAANPVLNPNSTILRMIQRRYAESKMREQTGQGGAQPAHSRRGYWCTLKHERYSSHPMFQVENGVYRKEAWVNCEPFSIGSVVYRPYKQKEK